MKAILEQNFNELYAQAKERIETCIKPVDQMTTFTFFVMWNTINQILFDVFHETRFMWNIVGTETDNKLRIRFLDQFKTVSTNEMVVEIRKVFKLISFDEFRRMSHDNMCKYVDVCCQNHGYSRIDLSKHFGKCDNYISNLYHHHHESLFVHIGDESLIARETLRRMVKEHIPIISPVWRTIFQKYTPNNARVTMRDIQRGLRSGSVFVDSIIEKAANDKFIDYLEELMSVVDEMIKYDSRNRSYKRCFASSLGNNLKLTSTKLTLSHGEFTCCYQGESLEKLKQFQQKLEKIITANKGGTNDSVR